MRKWKCVETEKPNWWTLGGIYETNDSGLGLIDNLKYVWETTPITTLNTAKFEEIKGFTKDDLEPCMVVVLRDGTIGMITNIRNGLCVCCENGNGCMMGEYQNNLEHKRNKDFDIISIYFLDKHKSEKQLSKTSIEKFELLYKREEKSEKELEIEKLESEMRDMADRIAKLKGE